MSWNFYPEDRFSSYDDYVKYLKERGLALDAPERVYKEKIVMKYIDTKKLIAEIERLQKENSFIVNHAFNSNMRNFYDGEVDCCKQLLSFINSLQQEEKSVAERFARIVRGNLIGIDKEVQQKFEQLYFEVTGNKMYGGYND